MGWGGNIGPNLDSAQAELRPRRSRASRTARRRCPRSRATLTRAQIKCVATVVATLTKGGGSTQAAGGRPARASRSATRARARARSGRAASLPCSCAVLPRHHGRFGCALCRPRPRRPDRGRRRGRRVRLARRRARSSPTRSTATARSTPAEAVRRLVAEHGGPQTTLLRRGRLVLALRLGLGEGRRLRDLPVLDGDGRARSPRRGSRT